MIEYQDPNRGPLNARDVSKYLRALNTDERRLAWLIHSLTHEPGGMRDMAKAVAKSLQGVSRPMPYLEQRSRRHAREALEAEPPPWFSSYDEDDTELSLRRWVLNGLEDGDGPELIQAALAYERQFSVDAAAGFYQTNIGREVWQTLDWCLETRRPVGIWGATGRGKTAALRAWCEAHRGEARFFTVDSYGLHSEFYRDGLKGFGLTHLDHMSAPEARYRLKSLAQEAGLVVVIDESHFALHHQDRTGRPPIIDWINTALAGEGVAVALVGTPQFAVRLGEIERKTGYNADQFRRRLGRWVPLPTATAEEDLAALAARYLPRIGKRGQKQAVEYARHLRDVSGLFDLVKDAQEVARHAGREEPDQNDFQSALNVRLLNDGRMDKSFALPAKRAGASRRQPVCEPIAAPVQPLSRAIAPAPQPMNSAALAARSRPALVAETV